MKQLASKTVQLKIRKGREDLDEIITSLEIFYLKYKIYKSACYGYR